MLLRLESMNAAYTATYCIQAAFSCWDNTANTLQVYCNSVRAMNGTFQDTQNQSMWLTDMKCRHMTRDLSYHYAKFVSNVFINYQDVIKIFSIISP